MATIASLIQAYAGGAAKLSDSIRLVPDSSWDATPVAGKWSIRQVICHLADSEIVYADRMKRVLVEDNPLMLEANPDVYVPKLFCSVRPWKAELNVIASVRAHMLPILKSCQCEDFERPCLHSLDGPLTLAILLERITMHIPHHIAFIEAKLRALGV